MKKSFVIVSLVLFGSLGAIALPAWAAPISFEFFSCSEAGLASPPCPNVNAGTKTLTYTDSGLSVIATETSGTPNLYVKDLLDDERGLGIANGGANEIVADQEIQIDTSGLAGKVLPTGTLTMNSVTGSDSFDLSFDGGPATLETTQGPFSVPIGGKILILGASGDVLINQLDVTPKPVPEPGSTALLGTGLVGLVPMLRRRKR